MKAGWRRGLSRFASDRASALGLKTTVIDEQPAPGGQIYRAIEAAGSRATGHEPRENV